MKSLKWVGKFVGIPLLLLIIGAVVGAGIIVDLGKSYNDDANWYGSPNGIDEYDMVTLGGTPQYVRVRGRNLTNPVMLDLHGGPGWPQTGWTYRNLRSLTEYFTLVEWDQRGTARSPVANNDNNPNSYDRMVDDAIELIDYLRQRFGVEKVTIVGHSWGAMLGLGVAKKRPDLVAAYVGVGQALSWKGGFDESRRLNIAAAERAGDTKTADRLIALGDEWPAAHDFEGVIERIMTIQEPLVDFGTSLHASKSNSFYTSDIAHDLLFSPEMSLSEALSMLSGESQATRELFADLHDRDLREQHGKRFEVPIFIFQGEHDWQTPTTLVRPWFEGLIAPHKEYVSFEHSAHLVINEQPGKYLYEMVTRVRPFADGSQKP